MSRPTPGEPGSGDKTEFPHRRIVIASMIGTTIEFYIYATAVVSVFPLLFFPKIDTGAALLASMATFGVAFVARPVGSVLFGHFGDRIGRKAILVGPLLTMGIATSLIGLLPTFMQIGLLVTETAEPGKCAWAAMSLPYSAPPGHPLPPSG